MYFHVFAACPMIQTDVFFKDAAEGFFFFFFLSVWRLNLSYILTTGAWVSHE